MEALKRALDDLMFRLTFLGDVESEEDSDPDPHFVDNLILLRNVIERERETLFIRNLFSEFFQEENLEDVKVTIDEIAFHKLTNTVNKAQCDKMARCSICLDSIKRGSLVTSLKCQHEFHLPCIKQWLTEYKVTCPICRKDVRE